MFPRDATAAEYALILALIAVTIISAIGFSTSGHPEPAPRLAYQQLQTPRIVHECVDGQVNSYVATARGERHSPATSTTSCKPSAAEATSRRQ